jgi:hypothetical protein
LLERASATVVLIHDPRLASGERAPSANLSRQLFSDSCAALDDAELYRCGDQAIIDHQREAADN